MIFRLITLLVVFVIWFPSSGSAGFATVHLKDNRSFNGRLMPAPGASLAIRIKTDGGEIEYRFSYEEIRHIEFMDIENEAIGSDLVGEGEWGAALPHLEAVFRQRTPFLPLLTQDQLAPVLALAQTYLNLERPGEAISLARLIQPYAEDHEGILPEILLLAHDRLGMERETQDLLKEWIEHQPFFGESAVGWAIQARIALDNRLYEKAIWQSLQPIVFSGPSPMRFLSDCYAIAATALLALGREEDAARLERERRQRRLPWPIDPRYGPTAARLEEILSNAADEYDHTREMEQDDRPPEMDLGLPIEHVRKIQPRLSN